MVITSKVKGRRDGRRSLGGALVERLGKTVLSSSEKEELEESETEIVGEW